MPPKPPSPRPTALEFMDLPLGPQLPVVWAITEYPKPTGRHYDIHAGVEIGIVLEGASRRLYRDHHFDVTPGEVWLAGLWEPHGMQILRPNTRHLVLGLLPEFLGFPDRLAGCDWLELFRRTPQSRPTGKRMRRATLGLAGRILDCVNARDRFRLARLRILLQELLLSLMAESAPATPQRDPAPAGDLAAVLQFVDQHPAERITLAAVADVAGMSRSAFAEAFRRQTGLTFGQYLTRRRIGGVMGELHRGDAKLAALADRWGFADASHLVRVFRQQTGLTPAAYRRHTTAHPAPLDGRDAMPRPRVFF